MLSTMLLQHKRYVIQYAFTHSYTHKHWPNSHFTDESDFFIHLFLSKLSIPFTLVCRHHYYIKIYQSMTESYHL